VEESNPRGSGAQSPYQEQAKAAATERQAGRLASSEHQYLSSRGRALALIHPANGSGLKRPTSRIMNLHVVGESLPASCCSKVMNRATRKATKQPRSRRRPRFNSVDEYLASLDDAAKERTLRSIIDLILTQFPDLESKISWNVPTIHRNGKYVVGVC